MNITKNELIEKENNEIQNKSKILKSNLRIENDIKKEEIKKMEKKIKEQYASRLHNNYICDVERNVDDIKQWNKTCDKKRIETEDNISNLYLLQKNKNLYDKNKMNLNERKGNYLSKRVEDRLFDLEKKTKLKNEEQKEYYTEDILSSNYNINKYKKGECEDNKNVYKNCDSQNIQKAKTKKNIQNNKSSSSQKNKMKYQNSELKFIDNTIKNNKQFKQVIRNNVSLQNVINNTDNKRRYPSCSFQSPSFVNNNYYHNNECNNIQYSSKPIFHNNSKTTDIQIKTFPNTSKQDLSNNHEYLMNIRKHLKDYYDNKSKCENHNYNQSLPKSNRTSITNNHNNNKINKSFTCGITQTNSNINQKFNVNHFQQAPKYVLHNKEEQKINELTSFLKQIPQATVPLSSLTANKPLPKYQTNLKYQYSLKKGNIIPKEFNYTRINKNNHNTNNYHTDLTKNYSFGIEQFTINNNFNQTNQKKSNLYKFNEDVFTRYTKSPNVIMNKQTNQNSCLNISNNLENYNSNNNTNSNLDYSTSTKPTNNRLQDLEQMRNFNFNLKQNLNSTNCPSMLSNNNNSNIIINKKIPVNYSIPVTLSKAVNSNTSKDKNPKPQIYGKKIPQGQITSYNSNSASASNLSFHSNVTTNENKHFNYFDYYQNNSYASPQHQNTNENYIYQKHVKTEDSVNNVNGNREDNQTDDDVNERIKMNEKKKNVFFEKIVRFEPSMRGSDYKSYSYGEF